MQSMLESIDKKLDMVMKHLGCESDKEDRYKEMSSEEKDKADEKEVMDKDE